MPVLPGGDAMKSLFPIFKRMDLHLYLRYYKDKDRSLPLDLDPIGRVILVKEWNEWEREYVPKSGLEGKTVLDVGTGCGETPYFFFAKGAARVICIEPDKEKVLYLLKNGVKKKWDIEVIERRFILEDLRLDFDYMKMDIESAEKILLGIHNLPPCSIEIHSASLAKRFAFRFPMMRIEKKYHWPLNTWMGRLD